MQPSLASQPSEINTELVNFGIIKAFLASDDKSGDSGRYPSSVDFNVFPSGRVTCGPLIVWVCDKSVYLLLANRYLLLRCRLL